MMGACISSEEYDQQQSSEDSDTSDEIQASSTKDSLEIQKSSTKDSLEIQEYSTEDSFEILSTQNVSNVKDLRRNPGYTKLDSFTYDEMRMATRFFRKSELLGEGGFGPVYKGLIDDTIRSGYPTTEVAVKVLNHEGFQGDTEWLTEVNYLGHLQHPNLVKLVGYCCEDDQRLLVYEFMAGGSLENHIFTKEDAPNMLTWSRRLKIAINAAKGLAFLHNAKRPVIFRDFKTSNVLLDANFKAKLSDFGLAKDGPLGDLTHVTTLVKGTPGYAAPEYMMTGHLTPMCDIYAFGVVLLELLFGEPAVDKRRPSGETYLVDRAIPLLIKNKSALTREIDPRMKGQYTSKAVLKVAELAYSCIKEHPRKRPSMTDVVEILETIQKHELLEVKGNKVKGGVEVKGNKVKGGGKNKASK
ncbi:hypothetical protein QVD17_26180 [Tagetes erecta]|uniref:non-specific serine/threonine protein kinase n=1 Tax=Tagetes erecta TaxID=13708 RepID=A0AAD8K6X9_TARER|nr:hypothetical protein QVD17_26180 [Tagetes erecta]